jgi:DNA (cytosine-5)-methyltransferase 1
MTVLEICAGGGGQALGLEQAGFKHVALVDNDRHCCETLRRSFPGAVVFEGDLHAFRAVPYAGVDLVAGGVPCPPFSIAGKQEGENDSRDLFPEALRVVAEVKPRAVLLENVRGFGSRKFAGYRTRILFQLAELGYIVRWRVIDAADFGVPQHRPRVVIVGLRSDIPGAQDFRVPDYSHSRQLLGSNLFDLMDARGWSGSYRWALEANGLGPDGRTRVHDGAAPTLVGGSKKHGGPDLGPTRARRAWKELGVDGLGIANLAPGPDFPVDGLPRLTVRMAARVNGFPDSWEPCGGKTAAYRQVGNAFPPPVARAVGQAIREALQRST